jgi:DNA-binding CsgD family transcriptional regulator
MLLHEEQIFKAKKLNFNLIEAIVELQTEQQKDELKIMQLEQTNQRLWFFICAVLSVLIISVIVTLLILQKKKHKIQMKQANEKLVSLGKKLNQTNAEKEMMSQEINEILDDRENRQELERVAPSILQEIGESKFRQRFELLYPLFLPRLRERIPSITRREELLSMLIVLKQDNKEIAELLAIAPRSVLMLRHRFRQKIGLPADQSLESFIESTLEFQNSLNEETTFHSDLEEDDSSL